MSYTPTNWQTGDTITAERLNNMEGGIENASEPFVITLTPTAEDFSGVVDKTVAEITGAVLAGRRIVFVMSLSGLGLGYDEIRFDGNVAIKYLDNETYVYSVNGVFIYNAVSGLVLVETPTNQGQDRYYSTTVYPLTPMS